MFYVAVQYHFTAVSILLSHAKIIQAERDHFKKNVLTVNTNFKAKLDLSLQKQRNLYLRKIESLFEKIIKCINRLERLEGKQIELRTTYVQFNKEFINEYPETDKHFNGIHTN